jgi:hypothetical protein
MRTHSDKLQKRMALEGVGRMLAKAVKKSHEISNSFIFLTAL